MFKSAKLSMVILHHTFEVLRHVVEHSIDKEEIPAVEPLLENSHLSESASCSSAGEEHCTWCLGFYENGTAHRDTAAELASCMAEEPILRNGESTEKSVKILHGEIGADC
jgi:hypothetical protein